MLAAAAFAAATSGASAQGKPLIERWLDGEVKAGYPAVTYSGPTITLRYSSFIPGFPLYERAFKRLADDTGGKLVVRAYWGNSLADAQRGAFESISGGLADFGNCYVATSPGGFHLFHGLQIPFIFETSVQGTMTGMAVYREFLKPEFEAKGVYLQRFMLPRPAQILTTKAPIEKLEDLRGKKMGALGSPFVLDILKALGAVPTVVPVPEIYTAMQSGVIDGMPAHDAAHSFFRLGELGKFHTRTDLYSQSLDFCMNKKMFDGLPADLKAIFYHWSQLLNLADAALFFDPVADRARADFEKRGIKMSRLDPKERERWIAAIQPVIENFVKANAQRRGAEFVAALRAEAERFGKLSLDDISKPLLEKPLPGFAGN
jgi:TRAP-type C4-dicarboxylate transport system substrate-binding protein